MFKDKKEELKRLADALMEDDAPIQELPPMEQPEEDPSEADILPEEPYTFGRETPATYYNYANNYGRVPVRNTDHTDTDLDAYSDAVFQDPETKSLRGLSILAACLLLAIAAVFAYCVLRYKGVLL